MFLLCVLFIAVVAKMPTYNRSYLRDQKRVTDEKKIIEAVTYIETEIFTAASKGLTEYSIPFSGCQDVPEYIISSKSCEIMVPRIRSIIARRFPDSEITHIDNKYTIYW